MCVGGYSSRGCFWIIVGECVCVGGICFRFRPKGGGGRGDVYVFAFGLKGLGGVGQMFMFSFLG